MTAAAYNLEQRWEIPAFVWPAVLGTSVAVHLAVLIYGLPNMATPEAHPEERTETELVLETGGLEYEAVSALEAAPSLSQSEAQPVPLTAPDTLHPNLTPATTVQTNTQTDSTVVPIEPQANIDSVTLPDAVENLEASSTDPVVTPTPFSSQGVDPVEIEAVEVQAATSSPQVLETEPQVSENTALSPSVQEVTLVESMSAETVVIAVEVQPLTETQVTDVTAEVTAPKDASSNVVAPVAGPELDTDDAIVPVTVLEQAATTVEETAVPETSIVSDATPVVVPTIEPVPETAVLQPVTSAATSTAEAVIEEEPAFADVIQAQTETSTVVTADEIMPLLSQDGETAIAIDPVEQQVLAEEVADEQVAEIVSQEIETAALSPADPQVVSRLQPDPDPAQSVSAVQVPSIDPLANAEAYVNNYNIGECAHLTVVEAGADNASVTAFGAGIAQFKQFDERFKADNGYSADIELRLVSTRQCALLDAIGLNQGVEAAGLVDLDRSVVRSGSSVTGVIQRDLPLGKIASANASGLGLDGKGPPEIYLIDGAGQIHDGRNYLLPASNTFTAGGWRFSVPVTLKSSEGEETALVLAIWNRPKSRQPARFGALPAERIADLLAEPGVYSLAAFKVSR